MKKCAVIVSLLILLLTGCSNPLFKIDEPRKEAITHTASVSITFSTSSFINNASRTIVADFETQITNWEVTITKDSTTLTELPVNGTVSFNTIETGTWNVTVTGKNSAGTVAFGTDSITVSNEDNQSFHIPVHFNQTSGGKGGLSLTLAFPPSAGITLSNPTRTGYNFTGWSGTGLTGNDNMTVTIILGSTGDKSYEANWTAITYTITFDKRSGTGGSNDVSTQYNAAMPPATAPTRAGYIFNGYWDEITGGTQYYSNTMASVRNWDNSVTTILYAQWGSSIIYNITYNLNSGNDDHGNPVNYTIETATITLGSPTRTGYTFDGWYEDSGFTGSAVTAIPLGSTGNKDYWAKWVVNTYNISYTLSGGTATNSATYTIETTAFTLINPIRTGYNFTGWSGTGLTGNTNTTVTIAEGSTGDRSYTANWQAILYTVTYNANNPSSGTAPAPASVAYDSGYSVASNSGNLKGVLITAGIYQRFLGWNTNSSASVPLYTTGQSFTISGDITLYAIFSSDVSVVGKIGPAGGLIFYDAGATQSWGRYLESAPVECEVEKAWGESESIITSNVIGSGENNTTAINVVINGYGNPSLFAAWYCEDLVYNGYNDWFLPSPEELRELMKFSGLAVISSSDFYWSSHQETDTIAYSVNSSDIISNDSKDTANIVRPVRAF